MGAFKRIIITASLLVFVALAPHRFRRLPVAVAAFALEAKAQGFGIQGPVGIAAAAAGSPILIELPNPEMRFPLALIVATAVPLAVLLIFMLRLTIRARKVKVTTGRDGMIGLRGRAQTAIAPEGVIFVRGELWRARSKMNIASGEGVRVVGLDGLTLAVEPESDAAIAPKRASAISND